MIRTVVPNRQTACRHSRTKKWRRSRGVRGSTDP